MPLEGSKKSGFKWGDAGHLYKGPGAKKKAMAQAVAISYSQKEAGKKPDIPVEGKKKE